MAASRSTLSLSLTFSVTSLWTIAPLCCPRGRDHCGPGQGWNLNPGWVGVALLVIGSHGMLDGETAHSFSLCSAVKVHQPDKEPEGRALPGGGVSRCSPWNRSTPLLLSKSTGATDRQDSTIDPFCARKTINTFPVSKNWRDSSPTWIHKYSDLTFGTGRIKPTDCDYYNQFNTNSWSWVILWLLIFYHHPNFGYIFHHAIITPESCVEEGAKLWTNQKEFPMYH